MKILSDLYISASIAWFKVNREVPNYIFLQLSGFFYLCLELWFWSVIEHQLLEDRLRGRK